MTLFKNKKNIPALHYTLNKKLQEKRDAGEHSFYYTVREDESLQVMAWASKNHIWASIDHMTIGIKEITYKFVF